MTCAHCDACLDEASLRCSSCGFLWSSLRELKLARRYRVPPPAETVVSLVYEPNRTGHSDIVVRVGSWAQRCDSYFFDLDSYGSVRAVLGRLLDRWRQLINGLAKSDTTYLAYDFSDQYSGWLACRRDAGGVVHVSPVWSQLDGMAFLPSDFLTVSDRITDFQPMVAGLSVEVEHARLLRDIDTSARLVETSE